MRLERAKGVDVLVFQLCETGRRSTARISPGWSRPADSPLPPFVPPYPREAPPRAPTWFAPCDQQALERWKKDSFKFPLYHHLWQNGLTNSETWRCPDADERERLLGFRPDHSRPAMSTFAKTWERERPIACSHICSRSCSTTSKCQRFISLLSRLLSRLSIMSRWEQVRSSRTRESTSSGDLSTTKSYRSRGATFGSPGAPRRVAAARTVHRGGNGESLWLSVEASRRAHQRVGTSSSYQRGPLALTVRTKHSLQRGPCNGFNGDFGSFGKKGAPHHFASRSSIFHPFTRVQSPRLRVINTVPLGRRTESDYERLLDCCVTV